MKKSLLLFAVILVAFGTLCNAQTSVQFPENALLNKPMPEVAGATLTGKKIDKAYFKGKVTLVNFMFIGCLPCMKEINVLDQLHQDNKTKADFAILGISANTAGQLLQFNSEDTSKYSRVRKIFKLEPVSYDLLAECATEKVKPANAIGCECNTISKSFLFNGHPTSFLIDKKGVVRKVFSGFPVTSDEGFAFDGTGNISSLGNGKGDQVFLKELQTEIDKLLAE